MKSYIVDCLTGLFALDESGTLVSFEDFGENISKKIEFFISLEEKILTEDYKAFLKELVKAGFDDFFFDNRNLSVLTREQLGYHASILKNSREFRIFRFNLETHLKQVGIFKSHEDLSREFKEISEELIKNKVSRAGEEEDLIIIHTIETIDLLKKTISSFTIRLREWYGIHFPELTDKLIDDEILMAQIISILGNRERFTEENLQARFNLPDQVVKILSEKADTSMGAEIDTAMMQSFADEILSVNEYRIQLENKLNELMERVAPNINAVIGSLIGAKLMAKAGSLKKLAFMPASRIQLLGAERALYRFLKTGQKVPKHGLIFQWNQIRGSPFGIRGNISRLVAGKIAIASKIDYFEGKYVGNVLSKEIEQKISEIKTKFLNRQKKETNKKPQPTLPKKKKRKKRKR